MWRRRSVAKRAPSFEGFEGNRAEFELGSDLEAARTSRPVVNALGPAAERTMTRVEGS